MSKFKGFRFDSAKAQAQIKNMRTGEIIDVNNFRKLLNERGAKHPPNPESPYKRKDYIIDKVIGPQVAEYEVKQQKVGDAFWIPGQVRSWKNSHQILRRKAKNGNGYVPFIGKSKAALEYEKKTMSLYMERAAEFRELTAEMRPVYLELLFCNMTMLRRWDFANFAQSISDMIVRAGWLADDAIDDLVMLPPLVGPQWTYDKFSAGVMITVLKLKVTKTGE